MSSQKKESELYKPFVSKAKGKKYSVYVMKNGSDKHRNNDSKYHI